MSEETQEFSNHMERQGRAVNSSFAARKGVPRWRLPEFREQLFGAAPGIPWPRETE